jgi:CelD/BcsL family acetyltransferase involved in cellulose biosynthesis
MDPAWTEMSVGAVMVGCAIRVSIEAGHTEFDFLRGTPAYKLYWTKTSRPAVTVRSFDDRLVSQSFRLKFVLRQWGSRGKRVARRALALATFRSNT